MILYRISKTIYANDLSGFGAMQYGGRWNSIGNSMIYTAETRSLCALEALVHIQTTVPLDYSMVELEVPDTVTLDNLDRSLLPIDWGSYPPSHTTQEIGDNFLFRGTALLLRVPSAILETGESNILINPHHSDIVKINIKSVKAFTFDSRLFR